MMRRPKGDDYKPRMTLEQKAALDKAVDELKEEIRIAKQEMRSSGRVRKTFLD